MPLFKLRKQKKSIKPRTPIKWFVIISIVVAIMAAIVGVKGGVIDFIEHYFSYKDNSYQPVDIGHPTDDTVKK